MSRWSGDLRVGDEVAAGVVQLVDEYGAQVADVLKVDAEHFLRVANSHADLLEALVEMVEVVENEVPYPADTTAGAREAIAKATGDPA